MTTGPRTNYTRPEGVMGGPCLNCQGSQPEHVGLTCDEVRANRRKAIRKIFDNVARPSNERRGVIKKTSRQANIDDIEWLCEEVERLWAALLKYGHHIHPNCYDLTLKPDGSFGERNGCLCGFDAVRSVQHAHPA